MLSRYFIALAVLSTLFGAVCRGEDDGSGKVPFSLAPAVALEAEDFTVERGWKVIRNGQGNYMVDAVGFNHISGEHLLGIDHLDDSAVAYADVKIPESGQYRAWVRYEYPAFSEARFRLKISQNGEDVLSHVMGKSDSARFGFDDPTPKAQHDLPWGSEGLVDEVITIKALQEGPARITLQAEPQPQLIGVSAKRNIDLIYLTRDTADQWMSHYRGRNPLYPILDAFRDTRGARWEVRLTNTSTRPTRWQLAHKYNRLPWSEIEPHAQALDSGAATPWIALHKQDTTHFGALEAWSLSGPFDLEVRPAGGGPEKKLSATRELILYLPPYAGKGEVPVDAVSALDAILDELKRSPTIGRKPTSPLCYGGWVPLGEDSTYGRKYAELYAALGFVSLHPMHGGPKVRENLKQAGVPITRSWSITGFRNLPTTANIKRAKRELKQQGLRDHLLFYDYGDEVSLPEWLDLSGNDGALAHRWKKWLKARRPEMSPEEYWLDAWGAFQPKRLRPDSSAAAAEENPRLYVDSLIFYEEEAIANAATGARKVRAAFGDHVLSGANYSAHPHYYPRSGMYIKWFRRAGADLGRHSEYFWQVGQDGPMVNGYIAEHFMAGMRKNAKAVLKQYNMPHSPGNTDANFLRSAYTHLAHGATMLDFFGIGLNETFTQNHIDHRDHNRFKAIREITHAVGFVDDILPGSRPVPSKVALLVSESTERWDHAGVAADRGRYDVLGRNFRETRLLYHLDRVGIWKALTFLGSSPDLLIEEDLIASELGKYRLLVLVGDSLPPAALPVLENWVKAGGVVLATASAGAFDSYRQPTRRWHDFFGIETSTVEEDPVTFLRPREELPFLRPLGTVLGPDWTMPQLAVRERVTPKRGISARAKLENENGAALIERRLGKGTIFYLAAHPGVAYLWNALQPPAVPDRGPQVHSIPTQFDPGAASILKSALRTAQVRPAVHLTPSLIDARLIRGKRGLALPLANYHATVGQPVTVEIDVGAAITKVTSAHHGVLPYVARGGRLKFTVPALGYGDIVRFD